MKRYYKWAASIGAAILVAASLTFLEQEHKKRPAAVATATSPSNADRIHEMKALEEDLAKNPEHPPILFRMAQLSTEMGKTADAISYLKRLVKVDSGNVEARLELGRLLYESGDVQGSMQDTSKILETDPKQVDALYNLGAIYANLNQLDQARSYWNRAVASAPASESGKRAKDGLQKLASLNASSVHP
jgi:tetratricopeptide (TPR) repeat protein